VAVETRAADDTAAAGEPDAASAGAEPKARTAATPTAAKDARSEPKPIFANFLAPRGGDPLGSIVDQP
jgi:hypothetical protein